MCIRDRFCCFCHLWGLLAYAPSSHVLFPIGTITSGRLIYLPSVPVALLLAGGCQAIEGSPGSRLAFYSGMAGLISWHIISTLRYVPLYLSAITIYSASHAEYPKNGIIAYNYAVELDRVSPSPRRPWFR
eukprot:TRINITY_DN33367_c0_g1_i1.p3 TRINITY_DN33367_c0_g1~~TRINITY_DN33367_c0_g1_i1.p3  ORF type:complete len:130 (+),score=12.90 TRINITY_DN33367_c0_g1_i1:144-533(+)